MAPDEAGTLHADICISALITYEGNYGRGGIDLLPTSVPPYCRVDQGNGGSSDL